MHQRIVGQSIVITADRYVGRIHTETLLLDVVREGNLFFQLPLVAGLAQLDREEQLSEIQVGSVVTTDDGYRLELLASSSLWSSRRFVWRFSTDQITFQHYAEGQGQLGRCYFFSHSIPTPWGAADASSGGNAQIRARRCFTPRVNHANQLEHDIAMPQSLGILNEAPVGRVVEANPGEHFLPEQYTRLFCPPPLMLTFGEGQCWAAIGIGDQPGNYLFNALEYSGVRFSGASFSVDYHGYRAIDGQFESPAAALHFGYSEYQVLEQHIAWVYRSGYGTQQRFPSADWHREPIVCGWAEQGVLASQHGGRAADYATQAYYEQWIATWEARGLPFGTIVIDDKWQRGYGSFDIDTDKWPDMPGFIARQHARGRRVLLWVPGHHREGLPAELCLHYNGQPATGDVSNPQYEAFLRRQIRHLMLEVGADGFKEDWIGGLTALPGLATHAPLFGIEFLRRFQSILYDEAHACKPDALIETQTPHPLFRESSDMLRLNDLWFGARNVPAIMRARARIATIAGWPILDCDNASSTCLQEWWEYMQVQPAIGVPSLYFVTATESTFEQPSAEQWAHLAAIWRQYRADQGLPMLGQ